MQHPVCRKAKPMHAMAAAAILLAAVLPLSAVFGSSEIPAQSSRQTAVRPFASLPAPGSYELLRIMRLRDTTLVNASAREEPLSTSTHGAITLLSFFYATCRDPEGCPVIWAAFEEVRSAIVRDPALAGRVRLVFISLDPSHDNPDVMQMFEKSYAESGRTVPWRFLTARSDETLAPLLAVAGQDIAVEPDADDPNGRVIQHMIKVLLIDPDGWVREIYTSAFLQPRTVLNDIKTLAMQVDATSATGERQTVMGRLLSRLGL
jgi:protein SCO1